MIAEVAGKLFLVLEQQLVFHAPAVQVQGEAHLREEIARPSQPDQLLGGDQPPFDQGFQRRRSEPALENPLHRVQVAQSARSVLDVRFEIGSRIAVFGVALLLLPDLGPVELRRRPDAARVDRLAELPEEPVRARQQARFQQRSHDRDVGACLVARFGHGAGAVTGLEPHVPEERQERADFVPGAARVTLRHQDQHVHVRRGIHFLAAVAPHRQQAGPAQRRAGVHAPHLAKQFVELPGAALQQFGRALPAAQELVANMLLVLADSVAAGLKPPFPRIRRRRRRSGRKGLLRVQPDLPPA